MVTKLTPKTNSISKIQKSFVALFFLLISLYAFPQIVITESDFPTPGYAYPYSQKPAPGIEIDSYTDSGANIIWDFSAITKTEQNLIRFISPTSTEIQYICIAVFNNPLDPEHDSDVAKPGEEMSDPMGSIQVTDVFEFFQIQADAYVSTGRSANVNGIPTCVKNEPADTIFKLPLNYGDTLSSNSAFEISIPGVGYYGQTIQRFSVADAWGTVITPFGTYNSLRIKSIIEFEDSIFYDSYGFGTTIPHTETHYIWLTNDFKIPVFTVEEKGQNFGGTIAFWIDTLDHTSSNDGMMELPLSVYPVPASERLNLTLTNSSEIVLFIVDVNGKTVMQTEPFHNTISIDISGLPAGVYLICDQTKSIHYKFLKN